LLMVLIPLQTTWAVAAGVRELAELSSTPVTTASGTQNSALSKPVLSDNNRYKIGCCAGCHVFCNFAAPLPASSLCATPVFGQLSVLLPATILTYRSYIPEGPIRPQWHSVS
jgi:hypothetical protein